MANEDELFAAVEEAMVLSPQDKAKLHAIDLQDQETNRTHDLVTNRQPAWGQHKKLQTWTCWASWGTFMFFSAVVFCRWMDAYDHRRAFNFWRDGGSTACFAGFFFLGTVAVELIVYLQNVVQSASDKCEVRRYAKRCDRARQNDYSTDWIRRSWLPILSRRRK